MLRHATNFGNIGNIFHIKLFSLFYYIMLYDIHCMFFIMFIQTVP